MRARALTHTRYSVVIRFCRETASANCTRPSTPVARLPGAVAFYVGCTGHADNVCAVVRGEGECSLSVPSSRRDTTTRTRRSRHYFRLPVRLCPCHLSVLHFFEETHLLTVRSRRRTSKMTTEGSGFTYEINDLVW